MTEKLFASLRTVLGSRSNYNKQIEEWARTEYGSDWRWAYNHMIKTGKPPIKGINY